MKLVTHSFGSFLAARYAEAHPNRPDVVVPAVASFLRGEWPAEAEDVGDGR